MKLPILSRWLFGAALAGAAVSLQSPDAKAVLRLLVGGTNNNSNCVFDIDNNGYAMEAWGYGSTPEKTCEAVTLGGSAMATCGFGTVRHKTLITKRHGDTLAYLTTLSGPSATQESWFSPSEMISYTIPSSPICPGGAVLYAQSIGYDIRDATSP
jgi:hypothetical protein